MTMQEVLKDAKQRGYQYIVTWCDFQAQFIRVKDYLIMRAIDAKYFEELVQYAKGYCDAKNVTFAAY